MARKHTLKENWIKEEQLSSQKRIAMASVKKRNEYEKGKVVTVTKHPDTFRCVILNFNFYE